MQFVLTDRHVADALRYMRVPPAVRDEEITRAVRGAFSKLEEVITPRCVYGRFHIAHFDGGIVLEGAEIHSRNIARLTAGSGECYLFAATLGQETDRQIALAQSRNMLDGVVLDACAGVRIDAYIDGVIREEIEPSLGDGEKLTHRFSPGYGDLSMTVTEDIIALLDASRRIGLSVTHSLMMTPLKSVTAVIGLCGR